MGWARGLQDTAQQGFNFIASFNPTILLAELHAYALRPIALRDRRNPDDLPYHFKLYRIINQT